jgi:hypothetical protein
MQTGFQCSFCGEWNVTEADPSGGSAQTYIEDCQVCCQANLLHLHFNRHTGECELRAERES